MLGKLNSCFGMSNESEMERFNILLIVGSGNISTLAMRRTFSNDPRNIRFGLSIDGMNPFGEMMSHPVLRPNRVLILCVLRNQVYTHTIQRIDIE
jgi:hypothetical protein